jgi:hypothetical protein
LDRRLRLIDWGDTSISHPFASLVVTFRVLEEMNELPPGGPWFARLREAYLEPWAAGTTARSRSRSAPARSRAFAWARQRDYLAEEARREFDKRFATVLRRALARTLE